MAIEDRTSLSGLTETEAQEFHSLFVTSFIAFTVIAYWAFRNPEINSMWR